MRLRFGWCAALCLCVASATLARAQDMSFSLEESGQGQAHKVGKPSKTLAQGLKLFEAKDYRKAALKFDSVARRKTKDQAGNVDQGQFYLGRSLFELGYYQSALQVFDDISAAGPKHAFFGDALRYLVDLSDKLPESSGVISKIGRYGVGALEEYNKPQSKELYYKLLFLMGRSFYDQGDFQRAIDLFQDVSPDAGYYVQAKFFEGISFIRLRKARPAIASFRSILEALDKRKQKFVDEDRTQNLAWISLARTYYTAANNRDERTGELVVDGTLLGQAVESWAQVQESSEYWLDAMFESSWAFFLADQYARALGNIHGLYSPFFPDAYYPEAYVLKAVTFFVNCQPDNANAMVAKFHEMFDPVRTELNATLAKYDDNSSLFELLQKLNAGHAELPPRINAIVSTAVDDRTVLRNLAYVDALDKEDKRLQGETKEFKDSDLGARMAQEISVARSFAVDSTGDLVRARYQRLINELEDLRNQVDTVELEIATFQRGQIDQEMQQQMTEVKRTRGGEVEVDEEHQMWPFDGEYWRDELGYYRQQVTNRCGR